MSHSLVHADDGTFAVDWPIVYRIVESYVRAKKYNELSKSVVVSQSDWYDPRSWQMPDLVNLEVDHDKVRDETYAEASRKFDQLASAPELRHLERKLRNMQSQTRTGQHNFRNKLQRTQKKSAENIAEAVDSYETSVAVAKFTRDTAATTLVIASSVVTGGSAAALYAMLGAGATLKGVGKYQDTGKIDAAVIETTGTIIFGVIPIGAAGQTLSRGKETVLLFLEAAWDANAALVEGKSMQEAIAAGTLKFAEPLAKNVFKTDAVQDLMGKTVFPAATRILPDATREAAVEFAQKEVEGLAWGQAKGVVEGWVKPDKKARPGRMIRRAGGSFVADRIIDTDRWYAQWAVIDMDKGIPMGPRGIPRSWEQNLR